MKMIKQSKKKVLINRNFKKYTKCIKKIKSKLRYATKKKIFNLIKGKKSSFLLKGGVKGRENIDISFSSPLLKLGKMKEGVQFGDKMKSKPIFPPYVTATDFAKFMYSFHDFYSKYDKAYKKVESQYQKIKKSLEDGTYFHKSGTESISSTSSSTNTSSSKSTVDVSLAIKSFVDKIEKSRIAGLIAEYESLNPVVRYDEKTGKPIIFYNNNQGRSVNISENEARKKKLRDHLYEYHKNRLQIKHAFESIENQADALKDTISLVKERLREGSHFGNNITRIAKDRQDKQTQEQKSKARRIEKFINESPDFKKELMEGNASEEVADGIIAHELELLKSEKVDDERIDKVLLTMDILFEKIQSIDFKGLSQTGTDKPQTYPEAMSLLTQNPEKFFEEFPNFFAKSQGRVLSYFLRKYLPWLMDIGIANDFFIRKSLGDALSNVGLQNNNNNVYEMYKETGQLSEEDLEYLINEPFNIRQLYNKKGYVKTIRDQKSTRSFADILDYQFERPAQRERRNEEAQKRTKVKFANEIGNETPLVTLVGKTAPLNNTKQQALRVKGQILYSSHRSGQSLSTWGQIQEKQNAKLLKAILRLGPLISDKPEDLITILLPKTEPGYIPSQELLEQANMLFPKEEDYKNFITHGHSGMDSLLIDLLIIQSLVPEGSDKDKKEKKEDVKESLFRRFKSGVKDKITKMLSKISSKNKKTVFDPKSIFSDDNKLEEDLERLEKALHEIDLDEFSNTTSTSESTSPSESTSTSNSQAENDIPAVFYDSPIIGSSSSNSNSNEEEVFNETLVKLNPVLGQILKNADGTTSVEV